MSCCHFVRTPTPALSVPDMLPLITRTAFISEFYLPRLSAQINWIHSAVDTACLDPPSVLSRYCLLSPSPRSWIWILRLGSHYSEAVLFCSRLRDTEVQWLPGCKRL